MRMNLHPLIVHFPIAFLTLYAVLELLRFRQLTALSFWFHLKAVLVILGTISAIVALQTGELIEDMFRGTDLQSVLDYHSALANAATDVFAFLALCYIVRWADMEGIEKRMPTRLSRLWKGLLRISMATLGTFFAPLIALIGLILMVFVGALGAVMVYGPDVDPAVRIIYNLLF